MSLDPSLLNNIGTGIEFAGNIEAAQGQYEYGQQAAQAAEFQATQLRQRAGQAMASSQLDAYEVDKQARYVASTALANAAGSGGGASDPTVMSIIANNASEMAFRKSVALYKGEDAARLLNLEADAKQYEGQVTKANADAAGTASLFKAGTSLMKGAARDSSMYQRFGGGGPNVNTSNSFDFTD
jgi:hypothetical protein